MPRTRRRRLQRQRKKHGIVPMLTPPSNAAAYAELIDETDRQIKALLLPRRMVEGERHAVALSRADLLAAAASAKTRQQRAKFRRMLAETEAR